MSALSSLPRARVPMSGFVRSVGSRVPPPSVARLRAAVTALFLDRTVLGTAMRALADDRASSALLGGPGRRGGALRSLPAALVRPGV